MAVQLDGKDQVAVKFGLRRRLEAQHFNLTVICAIVLLFTSSFNYGFSDQSFTSTQATTAFTKEFGHYKPKAHKYALSALYLALLNSIKAGTQLIGVFIGSLISSRYGRRWCIFVMSIYALCSTAVVVSSKSRAQMLSGRSIHYIYLGMELAVVPTFLAEISPASFRGAIGSLYWLAIKFGGLLATGIVRATSGNHSNSAWRIPISLIFILPTINIATVWLIPESPRWLLLKGRSEEALAALTRLRRPYRFRSRETDCDESSSEGIIASEFNHLSEATALTLWDRERSRKSRFRQFMTIFSREHLRRTTIVALLLFFQQSSGQSFASQYGTLFVKQLRTINPFSVTLGTNAIDIGGILICIALADHIGRRPMLIASAFVQTASLMTMGGLGVAESRLKSAKAGIVSMLLLYSFGWSLGYAPLAYVVAAELPSPALREYTIRVGYSVKLVMEFVVSFTYPYLEDADKANLGGKLGFIYGSVAFLALVFSILFVPETRRIELEEMDVTFGKEASEEELGTKMAAVDE